MNLDDTFLLLGNHSCFYDFSFAVQAIGNHPTHFVMARKYFTNPVSNWALKLVGAIPKELATTDMECVKTILRTLRRGKNVAIYPEGRVSMWGRTEKITIATASLAKRAGCNLVLVQDKGGFFSTPPYGGKGNKQSSVSRAFFYTKEEIKEMSIEEVYNLILKGLSVDQYDNCPKEGKNSNVGVKLETFSYFIYLCPNCAKHFTMVLSRSKLTCSACGAVGDIEGAHVKWKDLNFPSNLSGIYTKYIQIEEKNLKEKPPSFEGECKVEIRDLVKGGKEIIRNRKLFVDMEEKKVKISDAKMKSDEEITLDLSLVEYIPFDPGGNFQIYQNSKLYIIWPANPFHCTAISVMVEALGEML